MPRVLARFVHMSDTHLTPQDEQRFNPAHYSEKLLSIIKEEIARNPDMLERPVPASSAARALVAQINALPLDIDFVLHTGDMMTDPNDPGEYDWAHDILGDLEAPLHVLLGNHDLADGVSLHFGEYGNGSRDYDFDVNGVQVVCLDSATNGVDHGGALSADQMAWLSSRCDPDDSRPLVIAIHHPPVVYGIPLMDTVGFANGDALHEVLRGAGPRLQGVFSGHIHQGLDVLRDGIMYTTVQNPQVQPNLWPFADDRARAHESTPNPGFTVVTVTDEGSYLRRFTYPLPGS